MGGLTIRNVENVATGAGSDRIVGNSSDNSIMTGERYDTLEGGLGDDALDGGSEADVAVFTGTKARRWISGSPGRRTPAMAGTP
jgi:Ca2+-binding RTX toxin-like protein